jgi:hypothetical protein
MAWWRSQHLVIVAALAIVTVLGALAAPTISLPREGGTATPVSGTPAMAPRATPAAATGGLYDAIRPEQREDIVADTAGRLPRYTIDATLQPPSANGAPATVSGVVELRYTNTTGAPVDELPFRLNPNLRQYEEGHLSLGAVTVDGTAVTPLAPPLHAVPASTPIATPTVDEADLILARVPLPAPRAPGDAVTVVLEFTVTVPDDPPDGAGRFRYHADRDAWALAHWHPILAGYNPEHGWDLDPPAAWSNISFADAALYDVTITAPRDLVLVTPGIETGATTRDGSQVRRFVSGPARDFAIFADPALAIARDAVDGTVVSVYHQPGSAAGADQVLAWAIQALETYSGLFGPYPYTTLDVVAVPDVVGFEFPQMVWLGEAYVADPVGAGSRPGGTEFLVAHEVAHQWWYGQAGSNPHRHAFLDQGQADNSAQLYFEQVYGPDAARQQLGEGLTLPYATMLLTSGDAVVDQPSADFPDAATYFTATYRKAALGFAEIRAAIGDDAFFRALRHYVDTMRFELAGPADLRGAFEIASALAIGGIWHAWFETATGRVQIIMEPEGGTPAP